MNTTTSKSEAKYRHEYKYLVTAGELAALQIRLQGLIDQDSHTGETGSYRIRSVYFDDHDNSCFWQNEAGEDPRDKWRIRIYDAKDERITLEKKSKRSGMTHKEQAFLNREQAELLLQGGELPVEAKALAEEAPLVRQFALLMRIRRLRPKTIVCYERVPFVCSQGNVRITFDRNIAFSKEFDRFFEPVIRERPILPAGQHILEVKFDEFLPAYLKRQMELGMLRQTSFSKYYLCRKYES